LSYDYINFRFIYGLYTLYKDNKLIKM